MCVGGEPPLLVAQSPSCSANVMHWLMVRSTKLAEDRCSNRRYEPGGSFMFIQRGLIACCRMKSASVTTLMLLDLIISAIIRR